jgi:hypothetical protein
MAVAVLRLLTAMAVAASASALTPSAGAGIKRPRPSNAPGARTSIAPNYFQIYNDYTSQEQTYASGRAVVHYVVLGIDAPPLNDDDENRVPDYVERVGQAADRALAYYGRRGFRLPLPDEAGPDARPDIYVSRFSPGTFGVAFPAARAEGGAFVVVANNLDPSPERSFASVHATVAHELFHLVQFAYFRPNDEPVIPTWILEGTAAGLEARVNPGLDDLVSSIQLRRWFSATDRSITRQSYGSQLLWRRLDTEQPCFLPALLGRLAARPVVGDGRRAVTSTYAHVAGEPFARAFQRYALFAASDYADEIEPAATSRHLGLPPLAVRYVRVALPRTGRSTLTIRFLRARGGAAATLLYRRESDVPGEPPRTLRIAARVGAGGRTLAFTVSAAPRRSALLVLSNGGDRAVRYVVSTTPRRT